MKSSFFYLVFSPISGKPSVLPLAGSSNPVFFLPCHKLLSRPPKRRLVSFNKDFCDLFEHFVIPCHYRLIDLTVEQDSFFIIAQGRGLLCQSDTAQECGEITPSIATRNPSSFAPKIEQ
jgi:hypothetical protein